MKRSLILFGISLFVFLPSLSQWTIPRKIDPTTAIVQANPMVSVGPNRELLIYCNESTSPASLVCYKSTDLGNTFSRIIIGTSGSQPPWYSWSAGTPASDGVDRSGTAFLFFKYYYQDNLATFTYYVIKNMRSDSSRFVNLWSVLGSGGTAPSPLSKPIMLVEDSVLHVLRDMPQSLSERRFVYTRLSGDSLRNKKEYALFSFPPGYFSADLVSSNLAVHALLNAYDGGRRQSKLYYSRKLHRDSTFVAPIAIDTNYAASPRIANLGSRTLALLYSSGNGLQYSDSILTARLFTDGSTTFLPPFRVAAKPIRPATSTQTSNSPIAHMLGTDIHLVYRSCDPEAMVAYYRFGDLHSPPLDSAFFRGYDYADLALDSTGGKYLVMVGPDSKVYLSKRDVVSSIETYGSALTEFALMQNYPNPFNPTTSITFAIAYPTHVRLKVFDLLGREVATLVHEKREAGSHRAVFDASRLSSGVYFYRLQTENFLETKKMALIR